MVKKKTSTNTQLNLELPAGSKKRSYKKRKTTGKGRNPLKALSPISLQSGKAVLRIKNQDCFQGLKSLDAESIDVIVTSPPYNVGTGYSQYDDKVPRGEYLEWLNQWAEQVWRVLKPEGSLFFNVGGVPSDPWVPMQAAATVAGAGHVGLMHQAERFKFQNSFHWIKSIAIDKKNVGKNTQLQDDIAVGHYKPIQSPRFINDCHEYIFHFTKSGNVPLDRLALGVAYQDKSNVARWKSAGKDRRCRGNCWFLPYETITKRSKDRPHPATFPVQLASWCIKIHGANKDSLVMDPFLGMGSTALACAELEIPFLGFEIDQEYFKICRERLRGFIQDKEECLL